jgi:hypothetical protein
MTTPSKVHGLSRREREYSNLSESPKSRRQAMDKLGTDSPLYLLDFGGFKESFQIG